MKFKYLLIPILLLNLSSMVWASSALLLRYASEGDAGGCQAAFGNGGNINCRGEGGMTPLMLACQKSGWIYFDTTRTLVDLGANVNLTDDQGHTAYFYAKAAGHQKAMDYLIGKGADPKLEGPVKSGGAMGSIKDFLGLGKGTDKKPEAKTDSKISLLPNLKLPQPPSSSPGKTDANPPQPRDPPESKSPRKSSKNHLSSM